MLKFSKQEINLIFEALKCLMNTRRDSHKEVMPLVNKILETGKIDTSKAETTKIPESVDESVNEALQIHDKVKYDKQTGFISGEIGDKFIVMVQGNTYLVDPKDLKEFNQKPEILTQPNMKFDEETQKLLFEQYVRCGIFQGNTPVKMDKCYVKFNQWETARDDQQVKVIIEGVTTYMSKDKIRILENINDFASPDNYVPGVLIDQTTEEALQNILVNAVDYTSAIGDADIVKIIIKNEAGEQEFQSAPKAMIRTLTI